MLATAAEKTPPKPIVVRIGQMMGISTNGYWNTRVPTLFTGMSSVASGAFRLLSVSLLPVDVAASAVLEMYDAPNQVLHLAHPNQLLGRLSSPRYRKHSTYLWFLSAMGFEVGERQGSRQRRQSGGKCEGESRFAAAGVFPLILVLCGGNGENRATEGASSGEAEGMKQLSLREAVKLSSSLRPAEL